MSWPFCEPLKARTMFQACVREFQIAPQLNFWLFTCRNFAQGSQD